MKILFFQYGNFAEAYERFRDGGPETYRDQRTSVDYVETLSIDHEITVVAICDQPHDTVLTPTLRSIGVSYHDVTADWVRCLFDEKKPDRLICRTPHHKVLREAQRRRTPTLPCFADIFANTGVRALYRNLRIRRTLMGKHFPCVTNHSRNASISLHTALFFPRWRIVPWDRRVIQTSLGPKETIEVPGAPKLFYAGMLSNSKGLSDVLKALAYLAEQGVAARLSIASRDDAGPWRENAKALGVLESVDFLGVLPNEQVLAAMRSHDIVLVPTRHDYPEGLPNTLREALAVRTPLIISDHPAFSGRLIPEQDCLVFKAGDPQDLARVVQHLVSSPDLYVQLSENAEGALEKLPFGLYWDELWRLFLEDPRPEADWVKQNSLVALNA